MIRLSTEVPRQLKAVAELRWRMFVNGLRTRRGKMELASRIMVTAAFALGGLVGFAVATGGAWYLVAHDKADRLYMILWPVSFFWQFFPVMATAFTSNPDSSDLLRFPLSYRSYFLVRLAYGFCDPASALGTTAIFGILLGVTVAEPRLFPWSLFVLGTFALFNLILMQTVFAWLERWLAQRRTREILGVFFILFLLSFQLIGPAVQALKNKPYTELSHAAQVAERVQKALPPGLASTAISEAWQRHGLTAFASLLSLAAMTFAVGLLLHLRLRRQFAGENLSEAAARPAIAQRQKVSGGWSLPGISGSVAAVFEKEMRYLSRSGPMLLTLIMPVFMLLIFRVGAMKAMQQQTFLNRTPDMAFPAAAAYALLVMTNLVYNNFGADANGMQFFYASPVSFRQIVLGKNLAFGMILGGNTLLALVAVVYFYGPPKPAVALATLAGLLFAAPLNFTVGNLLSIYAPKRRDFATFGRQNVSQTTVLVSLGVQIVIVAAGAAAFSVARFYKNLWIAALIFLALAAISIPMYIMVLRRADMIAVARRETLLAELCRA